MREARPATIPVDPVTAGMYLATMVAQCDLLMDAGTCLRRPAPIHTHRERLWKCT